MKRMIADKLIKWKNIKTGRMPLLLHGARQVGKTYALREFGHNNYKNVIYINYEKMPEIHSFFDGNISPERIVGFLREMTGEAVIPGDTLIIFDEIQSCERALTALKYFAEDAPEYHITAAGSLLGIAIGRSNSSFPVGKVYIETLYPMNFEEYLLACGEKLLCDMIAEHFATLTQMPEAWHNKAMDYYRTYTIVGGMPAVVSRFIENGKTTVGTAELQELILNSYVNDMAKYAQTSESLKIIACFESIPTQLAKDNKKFQYSVVRKGGSASIFGDSLEWLKSAGVILKCQKTQGLSVPSIYADMSSFKVYMGDVGLLANRNNITLNHLLSEDRLFTGGLAENYVACQLKAGGHKLFYWESGNSAEVDFLLQIDSKVIPLEVKANVHSKSKSLGVYAEKFAPDYSIRVSGKNFGFSSGIKAVPLYAAHLL